MKNKIKIETENQMHYVQNKREKDAGILGAAFKLKLADGQVAANNLSKRIEVSPLIYSSINSGGKYILYNASNKVFFEVSVFSNDSLCDDLFYASNFLKEKLCVSEDDIVSLIEINSFCFNKPSLLQVDYIKEGRIILAGNDLSGRETIIDRRYALHVIINSRTGSTLIIPTERLTVDKGLAGSVIKMSASQRKVLDLVPPQVLEKHELDLLLERADEDEKKAVLLSYDERSLILKENIPRDCFDLLAKTIKKYFCNDILIYPVLESFNFRVKNDIWKKITRFYVGKSIIPLKCGRPYNMDENKNVVRISAVNMKILGISEMDKVIISHRNKDVSCKVLAIDKESSMFSENKRTDLETLIGIPAHIRKRLGITEVGQQVKVERDTRFLFRKHLNIQLTPILLALFSFNIFQVNFWITLVLSIAAIPFISFLVLSEKRNERG